MKLGIGFTQKTVAISLLIVVHIVMIVSLYRTLGITLHPVRADYDCVWW